MYKVIICIFIIFLLSSYATASVTVKDFCSSYGIQYETYKTKGDVTKIGNVEYHGVNIQQITIKDKGPYLIEFINIKKSDVTIDLIRFELQSLQGFFNTIDSLITQVTDGFTEECRMVEDEELMGSDCEGNNCGEDVAEHITYEYCESNWSLNLSELIEISKGLGVTNLAIKKIRSPTFNLDILELENFDNNTNIADIAIKNFKYTPAQNTILRHLFKSLDFRIAGAILKRFDLITFVHFLVDISQSASYITFRGDHRWYEVYYNTLLPYFTSAPFTVKNIKHLDATIIEDGVSVRFYNVKSTGVMRRGESIINSNLKFAVNVKANPQNLKTASAKDIFKNNSGSMDVYFAQTRRQSSMSNNNQNAQSPIFVDEYLSVTAPKHFEINVNATYNEQNKYKPESRVFKLESVLFLDKFFNKAGYQSIALQIDNYIPILEQTNNLKYMQLAKIHFMYNDLGMSTAIKQSPKFTFKPVKQHLASLKGTANGNEIYTKLDEFLKEPKSFTIDFTAIQGKTESANVTKFESFWKSGHRISIEVNGNRLDVNNSAPTK